MSKKLRNIHPVEVLREEFLIPYNITVSRLTKDTGISQTTVSQILEYRQRITADTALRLSRYFGTTPKFWLGLQDDYDIEEENLVKEHELQNIKLHTDTAA